MLPPAWRDAGCSRRMGRHGCRASAVFTLSGGGDLRVRPPPGARAILRLTTGSDSDGSCLVFKFQARHPESAWECRKMEATFRIHNIELTSTPLISRIGDYSFRVVLECRSEDSFSSPFYS